jgi:hypothetical protein
LRPRTRLAIALAIVVTAFSGAGAAATTSASASASSPTAISKKCGRGYVHARLSWGEKCLRAGQFCKVGNREYFKYGFTCPRSGHLKRRHK